MKRGLTALGMTDYLLIRIALNVRSAEAAMDAGSTTVDRSLDEGRKHSILVRGPNWVGDLVMSTPGFRALRSGFPDSHIALQIRPELAPLMNGAPWFDEILPLQSYHRGSLQLVREGMELQARSFDLGLCLPDSISSALLMRLAGVRDIVGYRGGGRGILLSRGVRAPKEWGRGRMVARERFVLKLVQSLGCSDRGTRVELYTAAWEVDRVEQLLTQHGLGPGDSYVILAPGASYGPSKLWPTESFSGVGDALSARGVRVVLMGSPSERDLCVRVEQGMKAPAVNLAGSLDLGSAKALMRRATLLVCNDAGARHIAVAFRVPCVVLMGPTSLKKTNLNLEGVRVLETDVDCRPCYLRDCPLDHRCMTAIEPAQVIAAVEAILGAPAHGAADE
jgi:heptosyltransferase-2